MPYPTIFDECFSGRNIDEVFTLAEFHEILHDYLRERAAFIEAAGRTELDFGTGASFYLSYTFCQENSSKLISKSNYAFLWNCVPNSELGKFRHGTSIVATCCQLKICPMWMLSVITWRQSSSN